MKNAELHQHQIIIPRKLLLRQLQHIGNDIPEGHTCLYRQILCKPGILCGNIHYSGLCSEERHGNGFRAV
ncbi:hypothetical protein D3C73_1611880 [compost metagenome]